MRRFTYLCHVLMSLALTSFGHAAIITLTEDTVIDAANSYPEPPSPNSIDLHITDGLNGPTKVELRDGGVVGGFTFVRGSSHLDMSGGQIQALVTLSDASTFTLSGGSIQPLTRIYRVLDPGGVLRVTDQATLNLRGGSFFGRISQEDNSIINVYGRDFTVVGDLPTSNNQFSGVEIDGFYADGSAIDISIMRLSSNAQVVLHTIP